MLTQGNCSFLNVSRHVCTLAPWRTKRHCLKRSAAASPQSA